ncbi:hypothetical protein H0H87_008356 [Tephrocybe sp. NHM501043]|nr:hypothetical protein H0H87_008356 [Tephrocybe sp. NHM501043]
MLLAKVCCIITAIQALGQCMEAFDVLVLYRNEMNWWIGDDSDSTPKQLKVQRFLKDVSTQWDSTYQMLICFSYSRLPLTKAMKGTISEFKDMKKFALTLDEWDKVDGMIKVLQYPYEVQMVMANQKLPILVAAIPAFEQFISKWECAAKHYNELSEPIDAGLVIAYKYYSRFDNTGAYVVAMFIHPAIKLTHIEKEWDAPYIVKAKQLIKDIVHDYHYNIQSSR